MKRHSVRSSTRTQDIGKSYSTSRTRDAPTRTGPLGQARPLLFTRWFRPSDAAPGVAE